LLTAAVRSAGRDDVTVLVRCTKPLCTPLDGEGETVVGFPDGSEVVSGWAYGAARTPAPATPPLAVEPTCGGVPEGPCLEFGTQAVPRQPGMSPVSIAVRCLGTCTSQRGRGETTITWPDGSTTISPWRYDTASPSP
jgi:hypothetical protein